MRDTTFTRGALPDPTPRLDSIPGQEHAKRALQVALVGGHSILLSATADSMANALGRAAHAVAERLDLPCRIRVYPACPCGYYSHPRTDCRCTAGKIQRHVDKLQKDPPYDIYVPMGPLPARTSAQESDEDYAGRVTAARANTRPGDTLRTDVAEFLRHAQRELEHITAATVVPVAQTIAQMAGEDHVCLEHLCEAVQYVAYAPVGDVRDWEREE